jgi:uncharacterized protein with PIN domain
MMLNTGQCPSCKTLITHVHIEKMDIKLDLTSTYVGVSYVCPNCQSILSVGIDPVALKTDTVDDIAEKLEQER